MLLEDTSQTLPVSVLVTVALPLGLLLVLLACLNCFRKKPGGFSGSAAPASAEEKEKNLDNSTNAVDTSQVHVNRTFTLDVNDTSVDTPSSTAISIEPLPDIASKQKLPPAPLRPRMGCLEKSRQDASLKLIAVHHPFPRNQIVYLKELGTGWFGKVIESDAEKITTGVPRSKVVVKMLKDDASTDEQQLFFEEVAPFRELEHCNVIRLLGQCSEMQPMLMIMECAALGNLKQYLRSHRHQQASLAEKKRLIQFAVDAASGLACLHGHNYLHRDLAARNCLVMSDLSLKIGDYGIAEDLFKEDYFTSGNELLPIRWMAPESLKQENGTWSSHNFSKESDVWSFGVVLWEIAMMGERPYDMLTDEAVLQGVIVEKVIRLPEPDIGMPNKDRLYEVMRFCWLDQSQRIKVDEIHSLLQQIASTAPEEGAPVPKDGISAFEQKWEHLMPNQRHFSMDSQLGSVSSGDSDLLVGNLSQPDSLEDLTASGVAQALPQAPPRSSRKKVSASAISIPHSDMSEAVSTAKNNDAEEPGVAPPDVSVSVTEETGQNAVQAHEVQTPEGRKEASRAVEPSPANAVETEFTEFTSYDAGDKTGEVSLNTSAAAADVFVSSDTSLGLPQYREPNAAADAVEVPSQIVEAQSGDEVLAMGTPDKAKLKPRKTSTPLAKDQASPSSSSSFSPGSSSSTFLTALTSSSGNLTDAYATASDSTLVTDHKTKTDLTESSDFGAFEQHVSAAGDHSLSSEILDATAVPFGLNDFDKPADESQNAQPSDPLPPVTTPSQNPFMVAGPFDKDDSFGEFTDASDVGGNGSVIAPHPPAPAADFALPSRSDASTTQDVFSSFTGESSMTASQTHSSETSSGIETSPTESKPTTQDSEAFVSFGTELSSLESLTVPAATGDSNQEQAFPSFATVLSSLSSLDANTATTPQAEPQSNPFATDQTMEPSESEPQKSSSGLNGLGGFSFDTLSSVSDVASNALTAGTGNLAAVADVDSEGVQQTPALFGDLKPGSSPAENSAASNPPGGLSSDASPDSGNQSGTQQSLTDLFGVTESASQDSASHSQGSSFEVLDSKKSDDVQEPSSTLSDFELLSGLSAPPASSTNNQSSSANPFSGDGGLLQDFAGAALAAAPASALKVGNGLENASASFSGEVESSSSSTDTDSTSNSDSSKDYICEGPWGEMGTSPPPSSSPTNVTDSEEYALEIASEIYLSRGVKMARPYETTFLEPIPEDPLPSISEESGAPTPSETSSVDVRFEDVFEWDDFMGEPLVGKERTSSGAISPRQSFDMPDWTLDVDSESVRSGSSLHSQRSDDLNKGNIGSDSLSTGSADTPNALSSVSDSEVILHERARTHRSYISDLLSNRTKGLTFNTATARTHKPSNFYSLYEEDFDLESDSESGGSCSPPVPNPSSESQGPSVWGGVSTLHAEAHPPPSSGPEGGEHRASTNTQDSQDGSGGPGKSPDTPLLDFPAFESTNTTATTASTEDGATVESRTPSGANGAPP